MVAVLCCALGHALTTEGRILHGPEFHDLTPAVVYQNVGHVPMVRSQIFMSQLEYGTSDMKDPKIGGPEDGIDPFTNRNAPLGMACAFLSGVLHAVSLGIRMHYGDVTGAGWWREGGFGGWLGGLAVDFISGALIWPSMVTLPVEIWEPLAVTSQLGCGYLLALFYFKEKHEVHKSAGLVVAVLGYLFLSTVRFNMGATNPDLFEADLNKPPFLVVCSVWASIILCLCAVAPPAVYYSVLSACVDALQFPSSRLLAEYIKRLYQTCPNVGIFNWFGHLLGLPTLSCNAVSGWNVFRLVFFWKLPTIFGYLYFQQLALQHGLMTVAAIFPLVSVMATVTIGAAYFGDTVQQVTVGMFVAAGGLLIGITLLSIPGDWNFMKKMEGNDQKNVDSSAKNVDVDSQGPTVANTADDNK